LFAGGGNRPTRGEQYAAIGPWARLNGYILGQKRRYEKGPEKAADGQSLEISHFLD
jgi:hypothetical protein